MTQKELLYFEDAIGHLQNIEKLLNNFSSSVHNEKIKNFYENENQRLSNLKDNLTNVLRGETNG